jgi:MoaA/NifB/PqqE/SkfB family radical SAM enzyme
MSFNEISLALKKILEFGVKRVIISGGEPLLRDDFNEILSYAHSLQLKIEIVTNGTLITDANINLLKQFASEISISLDGANEVQNKATRESGAFHKVIAAIDLLKKNEIRFNIITVLSLKNVDSIEEIIPFGKKLGAEEHRFIRFIPIGEGGKHRNWYIDDDRWQGIVTYLQDKEGCAFDGKYFSGDCGAGSEFFVILCNGDISLCTRKAQQGIIIGNILRDDLEEIWTNSDKFILKREMKQTNCLSCMVQ